MKTEFNNSLWYKDDYYEAPPELIHWPIKLDAEFNVESGSVMSQSVFEGIVRDLRK